MFAGHMVRWSLIGCLLVDYPWLVVTSSNSDPEYDPRCPRPSLPLGLDCSLVKPGRFCLSNRQCRDRKYPLCCETLCGGSACTQIPKDPEFDPNCPPALPPGIAIDCLPGPPFLNCYDNEDCGLEDTPICCPLPCSGSTCKVVPKEPELDNRCLLEVIPDVVCKRPGRKICRDSSDCVFSLSICCGAPCGGTQCIPLPKEPVYDPRCPPALPFGVAVKCASGPTNYQCLANSQCSDEESPICCPNPCLSSSCKSIPSKPVIDKNCPAPLPFGVAVSCTQDPPNSGCYTNQDCPDEFPLCCDIPCGGTTCKAVPPKPSFDEFCPVLPAECNSGASERLVCRSTNDGCQHFGLVCCPTKCGGSDCIKPTPPVVNENCPALSGEIACFAPGKITCKSDEECKEIDICCFDDCGGTTCKRISQEEPVIDYECPSALPFGVQPGCLPGPPKYNCYSNDECSEDQPLCCDSACQSTVCKAIPPKPEFDNKCPPAVPFGVKILCTQERPNRECINNEGCAVGDNLICCATKCGGTTCKPIPKEPVYDPRCPPALPFGVAVKCASGPTNYQCLANSQCSDEESPICCPNPCLSSSCKSIPSKPKIDNRCPAPLMYGIVNDCPFAPPEYKCYDNKGCPNYAPICCDTPCSGTTCKTIPKLKFDPKCPPAYPFGLVPLCVPDSRPNIECLSNSHCYDPNPICCPTLCGGATCKMIPKDPVIDKNCPAPLPFGVAVSCTQDPPNRGCYTNENCFEQSPLCCDIPCGGTTCKAVPPKPSFDEFCPALPAECNSGASDRLVCRSTKDGCLQFNLICCPTKCGGSNCIKPTPPVVNDNCPALSGEIVCVLPGKITCRSDEECKNSDICCFDDCGGTICKSLPQEPVIDYECPSALPFGVQPGCLPGPPKYNCYSNDECSEDRPLCCDSACQSTVCKAIPPKPKFDKKCPPAVPFGVKILCTEERPNRECFSNEGCYGDNPICCATKCGGTTCKPIPEVVENPGVCPEVADGQVGICVEICENDGHCNFMEKCCSNGCGHICRGVTKGK